MSPFKVKKVKIWIKSSILSLKEKINYHILCHKLLYQLYDTCKNPIMIKILTELAGKVL